MPKINIPGISISPPFDAGPPDPPDPPGGDILSPSDPATLYYSTFVRDAALDGQGYTPRGGEVWAPEHYPTSGNAHAGGGYLKFFGGNANPYKPSTTLDNITEVTNGVGSDAWNFSLASNRPEMDGSPSGLSDGDDWGFDQRFFKRSNSIDTSMTLYWPGQSEVWLRMYVKFCTPWRWPSDQFKFTGHFGNENYTGGTQITANFWFAPSGDSFENLHDNGRMQFVTTYRTGDNSATQPSLNDFNWNDASENESANYTLGWWYPNRDTWYEIEYRVKQSTIEGTALNDGNGEAEIWIDGVQRFLRTDLNNKNTASPLLDSTLLGNTFQQLTYDIPDGEIYHQLTKNLQVATKRIGYDR